MTKIVKQRMILGVLLLIIGVLLARPFTRSVHNSGQESLPTHEPSHNLMGPAEVIFLPPPELPVPRTPRLEPLTAAQIENLENFSYLTSRILLADPETILLPSDIDVHCFLQADLTIDKNADGPVVLIFHAHSAEMFIDSDPADPMTGVMGVGRYLAQILATDHGLETMHHTGRFDIVDGRSARGGSYERLEPIIRQILYDNPSIQVVIDLHRDGVGPNGPPFVSYVDGQATAQIMFFNGLSRQNRGGQAINIDRLPNPYQRENLNFSFRLQLAANQLYPGLARRVYLRQFRYSLHMMPLSTLVEVGNQHNTVAQAKNAMHPLANIIAAVVAGEG